MAKSKYYGVTRDGRINKWKVQLFIAGKPRFFGYFEDEKEAGQLAQNARLYLQDFFPKPPPTTREFEVTAPGQAIAAMSDALIAEKAPAYRHLPTGAESVTDEISRLFEEFQTASTNLQHCVRRINAAFKRIKS